MSFIIAFNFVGDEEHQMETLRREPEHSQGDLKGHLGDIGCKERLLDPRLLRFCRRR